MNSAGVVINSFNAKRNSSFTLKEVKDFAALSDIYGISQLKKTTANMLEYLKANNKRSEVFDFDIIKAKVKSESKATECVAFKLSIDSIKTDEARFQNRENAFSELSAQSVAENYDPNLFDPIVVWIDPKNKQTYVLSGHSRLEGMKRRQEKTIPARYFNGSESEAIRFAKVQANRGANKEDLLEDLKAYKLMRDGANGIPKASRKELKETFKERLNKLEAYSYLDTKGLFIYAMNQSEPAEDEMGFLPVKAMWVGFARKKYPKMTNAHEAEVFRFLLTEKGAKIKREEFDTLIDNKVGVLMFDPELPLMLERNSDSGGVWARADTKSAKEEINELEQEIKAWQDKLRKAITDEEKKTLRTLIDRNNAEIIRIRNNVADMVRNSTTLFGKPDQDKPYWKKWNKGIKGKVVSKDLKRNGWIFVRQKGSHKIYNKGEFMTVVPGEGTISDDTFRKIVKQVEECETDENHNT
jgi:predicted RNA binding protein YcfA (HicA-like mRNA interferase family)